MGVVRSVEFLGGMAEPQGWRPRSNLPEIAFAGRSNVGKSSLVNRLLRRRIARVSRTPGRTRTVNFYKANDRFVLADLPGYGFARAARQERDSWYRMVRGYLTDSPQLRGVVLLLDVRHDPTRDDLEFMDFLAEAGLPVLIAVTKVDKVSAADAARRLQGLAETLDVGEDQLLAVSSRTGKGIPELERAIAALLESHR